MLAVLDPVLFDPRAPVRQEALAELVQLLRHVSMSIPAIDWYWDRLAKEFLAPLSRTKNDPEYRAHLDALRGFTRAVRLPPLPSRVTVWDFQRMFAPLGPDWVDVMRRIVAGCAASGEPTVLLTRLREGRNATVHRHGHVVCVEKTCWNLRLRLQGHELLRIPCLSTQRNHAVPWTCRYDDRLPGTADAAAFPFCPHPQWHKHIVETFRTHGSRPTWVDAHGNAWAKPSTGEGHHWDVYLTPDRAAEYGLAQLNIVAWGEPKQEGPAGSIHHIPKPKQGLLHKHTGWTC